MSELTRTEVLAKKRDRYARAGKEHKAKILDELVELFGYHRKAATRALRPRVVVAAPFVRGRPKEYDPDQLLPPLKAIWLPAYEEDHHRLDPDVRASLLAASRATLDRLLIPARVTHRRRTTTRPGSLLRAEIPIRTEWTENAPGFLEMDTVALCGGCLDDRHGWMFDAVDIRLDPPGFALERFDAVGRWRDTDGGTPVDAGGEWNSRPFDGPAQFKQLLSGNPDEFTRGFIEHLLSYALGRKLELADQPAVSEIQRAAAADGYRFSRVVTEIVKAYSFGHVRNLKANAP